MEAAGIEPTSKLRLDRYANARSANSWPTALLRRAIQDIPAVSADLAVSLKHRQNALTKGDWCERRPNRWSDHMYKIRSARIQCSLLVLLMLALGCRNANSMKDDAAGRQPSDFPELAADVFKPMDGGIELTAHEIKGRN